MPAPVLTGSAQRLAEEVRPWLRLDADHEWTFHRLLAVLGVPFAALDDARWERLLDPAVAPDWALPWLAIRVGVPFTESDSPAVLRARLLERVAKQGTDEHLRAAARLTLTGAKRVLVYPRDGGRWKTTVITYTSETPDTAATLAALMRAKAAGLKLTHSVVAGWTVGEAEAAYSTVGALEAANSTITLFDDGVA